MQRNPPACRGVHEIPLTNCAFAVVTGIRTNICLFKRPRHSKRLMAGRPWQAHPQNLSFAFLAAVKVSWSEADSGSPSDFLMSGSSQRRNGFVASSCPMLPGTVGRLWKYKQSEAARRKSSEVHSARQPNATRTGDGREIEGHPAPLMFWP